MFCGQCGTRMENGVCPRCGRRGGKSNSVNPTVSILKCIFIPLGIAFVIFMIATLISVFYNMQVASGEQPSEIAKVFVKGVIPFLQIPIPLLIILLGWIPIFIMEKEKAKKRLTR